MIILLAHFVHIIFQLVQPLVLIAFFILKDIMVDQIAQFKVVINAFIVQKRYLLKMLTRILFGQFKQLLPISTYVNIVRKDISQIIILTVNVQILQ
ncbi:unnamed protein product [Paramecium sonneborni]|uniref:Transmembrane protein n=1 Tax=Paramecium sonneborni TaxID=65129 RepID=A0A8S1RP42_9CILI|nr:unnamed protein product [Paramecium sonneborni]